jgi:hypothetical protein
MGAPAKTTLKVSAETMTLLATCLAWLFSYRAISIVFLERYMRAMMPEEPDAEFIKELFTRYCTEVSTWDRKKTQDTAPAQKRLFKGYS